MTYSTDRERTSAYHAGTFGEIKKSETVMESLPVTETGKSSDAPYKGLNPYTEADASIFFGRRNDIQKVVNSLLTWRLTILYGQSGVGKSSLLRAGVTHALNEEAQRNVDDYADSPKLAVVVFPSLEEGITWKDDPLAGLMKQIEKTIARNDWSIQPPDSGLPFVEALKGWTEALGGEDEDGELYIILDQFEEYLLYHSQENSEGTFAVEFPRAVNASGLRVNFLISIRDDSFAQLDRFKGYISKQHTVRIKHLDQESAREAIEEPVKIYNDRNPSSHGSVEIKAELIDAVLKGVSQFLPAENGNAGTEKLESQIEAPYLQVVMTRLWETKNPGSPCLDLDILMRLANKNAKSEGKKILSAVENIFREHLETALCSLSSREKNIAASVFQYLVTPSRTKYAYSPSDLYANASDHEEELEWTEPELTDLLERLASGKQRVIRPVSSLLDQSSQARQFEIFHDVLAQPILDWRKRHLEDRRREQERQKMQQLIEKEKMRSTVTIKKGLATQSLRQQRLGQAELAALLARQAYHFNQRDGLQVLDRVDDALRQVLSKPHFSNVLKRYSSVVSAIAFSLDGTKLAAASLDGKICLWDREQYYLESNSLNDYESSDREKEVHSMALSPDGQWLASGNFGKTTIRLWDLRQEIPICTELGQHDEGVTCLAFSPDGNLLASGSEDQTVKLWHWQQPDQDPIVLKGHSLKGKMGIVRSLAFSPDGSPDGAKLAVGCLDRAIWLWDVQEPAQTSEKEPIVRYGHEEMIRSVAFSPDGKTLASASDDRTVRLWDLTKRRVPQVLQEHTEPVRTIAFSPDGTTLASASDDQTIRLWNTRKLNEAPQILRGHTFDINSVVFSPDSRFLASGSGDNTVRLWNLYPPIGVPKILKGHQEKVRAIAISSQNQLNQLLASGSEDRTVQVWEFNQLDAEPKIFKHCDRVFGVALFVSSDRQIQLLAAGSADNIIHLWNLKQPPDHQLKELKGHTDGVSSVAFSPDGKWLASGSWKTDRTVRLWNLQQLDAEPILFKGHTESVTSVTFSPDGTILASASDDKTVLLWKVEQPDDAPIVLKDHNGRVASIAFSPDGLLLASASDDWTVRLWNLQNLDPDHLVHVPLIGHSAWVSSVAFSPDGKTLASGSFDRSIRLWKINQIDWDLFEIKEKPIILENHNQSITSVAFTPDGKYLASGSYDNTVRLWLASTEMLAEMVCEEVLRNLTMREWQQFMGDDIPYESTCPNLPSGEGMPDF